MSHDIADATQWDDLFVNAMAMRLAEQIADRITGDLNRKRRRHGRGPQGRP
jgi:hypothetical protein